MMNMITHSDAAEAALRWCDEPLPIDRLLELAIENGAIVGGDKPLPNFRSALSKDQRFYSLIRNGSHFWWLNDLSLPREWDDALASDSMTGSDASS